MLAWFGLPVRERPGFQRCIDRPAETPPSIGMLVPVIVAAVLFCVSKFLCRQAPVLRTLFRISAYANVTYLIAWVPGISWLAGLWRFYLIGVGLVHLGGIGRNKAVLCVLLTALTLLAVILTTLRVGTFNG